jgi:nitronate monooxygenase
VKPLEPMMISGREVLPLVEGGKGISVSTGLSSGAWAATGGVGTFSAVNADFYDDNGEPVPQIYHGTTRRERHAELIAYAVKGGISQAKIAHDLSKGAGRIHMNVLWEAGGTEHILQGILEGTKGLVHGVTCGAGMPYKVAQIAAQFGVYYYPIVSSARAFEALWRRAYNKNADLLGGVVYEDPWLAGGHNGLSNSENPQEPQGPFERVRDLRTTMAKYGQDQVPIIVAGGVWCLREWEDWIDNPELGPIAFQFGTRALLTQESPIPESWKKRLPTLKEGDVFLNRFSPTGFYSSAVKNRFIVELQERNERQVAYARKPTDELSASLPVGARGRPVYLSAGDKEKAEAWISQGFTEGLKTPDSTLIFLDPNKAGQILVDQQECMGCLSACRFSNWAQNEEGNNGKVSDPRSYCIQKTLQSIAHGGDLDGNLMFSGHNAYRFASDPFYADGFVPTVAELIQRILAGD